MTEIPTNAARRARISDLQERFLATAGGEPACLRGSDLRQADLPDWVRRYSYALQPWPTFLEGEILREVRRVPVEITRLVAEIPDRLFGGDVERMDRYYGLTGAAGVRSMLHGRTAPESVVSRVDLIEDAVGLRCLEVNLSAQVGGWQPRFWARTCLDSPCVQGFLDAAGIDRRRLVYRDPLIALLAHAVDEALERRAAGDPGSGAVHVVLTLSRAFWVADSPVVLAYMDGVYQELLATRYPGLEGSLEGCHYEELSVREGRVWLGGHPVDAVLEYHWDGYTHPEVGRCAAAGTVGLYNGAQTHLLNDKRNLALLSENAATGVYDRQDRELIERHVPWTRRVADGFTEFRGGRCYLPDLLLDHRTELVLKEARSARGEKVLCGWMLDERQWQEAAERAAAEGTWIVQERVVPLLHEYQTGDVGSALHDVVWGLFSFGRRFGGGFLRMLPVGQSGVINSARGASEGILYEVDDTASTIPEGA